jgi:hypothetical protein
MPFEARSKIFGSGLKVFLALTTTSFLLGYSLGGARGGMLLPSCMVFATFLYSLKSESGFLSQFHLTEVNTPELLIPLKKFARKSGVSVPKIYSSKDPGKWAFAIRSLGGRGTLVLGAGILLASSDAEIESTILAGIRELSSSRLVVRSVFARWAYRITQSVPETHFSWIYGKSARSGEPSETQTLPTQPFLWLKFLCTDWMARSLDQAASFPGDATPLEQVSGMAATLGLRSLRFR